MHKTIKTGIAALSLAFGACVASPARACSQEEISKRVRADFAVDVLTGATVYEHNADAKLSQASLTKRAVLFLLMRDIRDGKRKLTDWITLTDAHLFNYRYQQTRSARDYQNSDPIDWSIKQVKLGDALFAMNQASSNRVPDSFNNPYFIERINILFKELGMKNSHALNTTGFPTALEKANENLATGHHTTARDHALLVAALYREFPEEMKRFSQIQGSFQGLDKNGQSVTYSIKTHINLLPGKRFGMEEVVGGKTGYICKSGFNEDTVGYVNGRLVAFDTFGHSSQNIRDSFQQSMVRNPNRDMEQALSEAEGQPVIYTDDQIKRAIAMFLIPKNSFPSQDFVSYISMAYSFKFDKSSSLLYRREDQLPATPIPA